MNTKLWWEMWGEVVCLLLYLDQANANCHSLFSRHSLWGFLTVSFWNTLAKRSQRIRASSHSINFRHKLLTFEVMLWLNAMQWNLEVFTEMWSDIQVDLWIENTTWWKRKEKKLKEPKEKVLHQTKKTRKGGKAKSICSAKKNENEKRGEKE